MNRQTVWRDKKLAAGLCGRCGQPRKPGNKQHCEYHAVYMVVKVRESQIRKWKKEFAPLVTPQK